MKTKFFKILCPLCIALLAMTFTSCEKPDDNPVKPPELPGEVDAVKGRHTATKFIDSSLVVVDNYTIHVKARFERTWEKGKDTVEVETYLNNSEFHTEPIKTSEILKEALIESTYSIKEEDVQPYRYLDNLTIYQYQTTFSCGINYKENGINGWSLSKVELKSQRAVYKDDYLTFNLPYLEYLEILSHGGNFGIENFEKSEYYDGIGTMNYYHIPYTHRVTCKFGNRLIDKLLEQTIVLLEVIRN